MPDLRVSRRRLLKVIAASGGSLVASATLPGKWMKPTLRVGVLPVHAQTSAPQPQPQTYQIVDTNVDYLAGDGCFDNLSVTISPAHDGIQMQVVVCNATAGTIALAPAPVCQTMYGTTTAGVATFDNPVPPCYGATPMTVTFGFVDAAQCSGANCSVQYACDGTSCAIE